MQSVRYTLSKNSKNESFKSRELTKMDSANGMMKPAKLGINSSHKFNSEQIEQFQLTRSADKSSYLGNVKTANNQLKPNFKISSMPHLVKRALSNDVASPSHIQCQIEVVDQASD